MITIEPKWLFLIGGVLVLVGWLIPLLMIMKYIESTFFLNFLSYIASFLGLVCGIIAAATYVMRNRK
jgi:cytosine/uracil/thiamine/allantoin permease